MQLKLGDSLQGIIQMYFLHCVNLNNAAKLWSHSNNAEAYYTNKKK